MSGRTGKNKNKIEELKEYEMKFIIKYMQKNAILFFILGLFVGFFAASFTDLVKIKNMVYWNQLKTDHIIEQTCKEPFKPYKRLGN